MKRFVHILYHVGLIFNQKTPVLHKAHLFMDYVRMAAKKFVLVDLLSFNPTHEYFLNYFMQCFSYAQFVSLFEDIFIREEYFFQSHKPNPSVIDGGSHIGMSILYFKYLYPNAAITGFEPDPDTFQLLKKNIETNKISGVTLVNKGLANTSGTRGFYYDDKLPGSTIMSLLKERHYTAQKQVGVTTLSSFISQDVSLLKLDIEGMELLVLKELAGHDKLKHIQNMIIEYHHHIPKTKDEVSRILTLIENNGFSYQLTTALKTPVRTGMYQDIGIYAYRRTA
ncbi:MAG: FkbM family methyltransferase [Patescibacteria group bacterium]